MQQFKYKTMSEEEEGSNINYGSFTDSPSPGHQRRQDTRDDSTMKTTGEPYQSSSVAPASANDLEEDEKIMEVHQDKKMVEDVNSPHMKIDIEDEEKPLHYPGEPLKTLLAGLINIFGFMCSVLGLALTHDRVPASPPLPDIVLDNFPYKEWALRACNLIVILSTSVAFLVIIFHTHRLIILRRVFLMLGLLYMYRAVTMSITVLPNPDQHFPCASQHNQTTFSEVASRMLKIADGGGLSARTLQKYCGDYIFSGHTIMLTMGYMTIKDYSPRSWFLLHWASLTCAVVGVTFLLLQRVHYSIDVVLAYWVTSRLWYLYHTAASNQQLKQRGGHNYLDRIWWWRIFIYFEGNVPGPLPTEYSLPLPDKLIALVSRRTKSQ